ncbi:AraC-like DNA-binding protein [Streptococcus rupicaprae]|uniref:AraC-like DNA-binding protein n=1 Tax=Streptococcus rupicaprae TaxID=759619 RepID=A0ABV2FGG7_9STRE
MTHLNRLTDISSRANLWNVRFNNYLDYITLSPQINVYQSGHKWYSTPGYLSEPAIYDHYIIHYIISGKGKYFIDGEVIEVNKGDCFLIPPYKVVQYQASHDSPWTYYWIGFNGIEALDLLDLAGFTNNYVLSFKSTPLDSIFNDIVSIKTSTKALELALLGQLYTLFAQLINNSDTKVNQNNTYYNKAIQYIQENYSHSDLSITKIASHVGLTRSYLYKIFIQVSKLSISDTITNVRLSKALSLIRNSNYSIQEIAFMVGFNSQAYFSKIFKLHFNISPTDYRKQLK